MRRMPVWELRPGDEAPSFSLPATGDSAGRGDARKTLALADFRGRPVVLAFLPGAWSPICSVQLPSWEEDLAAFTRRGAQILAVTTDSVDCNDSWARSLGGLSFPLLSDFWPHGQTALSYGVLRPIGVPERAVFVLDRQGVIRHIDVHDVDEPPPVEPIFAALDAAAAPLPAA